MSKGSSPDPDGETDRGTHKKRNLETQGQLRPLERPAQVFSAVISTPLTSSAPESAAYQPIDQWGGLERAAASYLISQLFNRSTGLLCILFTYIVCTHVVKGLSSATRDSTSQLSLFGDHLDGTLDRLCTQKLFSHAWQSRHTFMIQSAYVCSPSSSWDHKKLLSGWLLRWRRITVLLSHS